MRYIVGILLAVGILGGMQVEAKVLDVSTYYNERISENIAEAIEVLKVRYGEQIEVGTIGESTVDSIPIQYARVGKGEKSILINGGHHGRESMTALLVLDQLDYLLAQYEEDIRVREILNTVSIYFVPTINPEGHMLAMTTMPNWKANGRGVDLNRNYTTPYDGKSAVKVPASKGYPGIMPFSEKETQALRDFCLEKDFEVTVAYHSAGEVIYWWWFQQGQLEKETTRLVTMLERVTGYKRVPKGSPDVGMGFTDWVLYAMQKPGFTIEIGKTVNQKPLLWKEYAAIWQANKDIPLLLAMDTLQKNTLAWQTVVQEQEIVGKMVYNRGIVPVEDICQLLGIDYVYGEEGSVTLYKGQVAMAFVQGEKEALLGDEIVDLVLPLYDIDGTTYLPLRNVLDVFEEIDDFVENTVIPEVSE